MPSAIILAQLALALGAGGQTDAAGIVQQSDDLLNRAVSVQGTYVVSNGMGISEPVVFALSTPNRLLLRSGSKVEIFDGTDHYIAMLGPRTYERRNAFVYGTPYLIGFTAFVKRKDTDQKLIKPEFGPAEYVRVGDRSFVRHTTGTGEGAIAVDIDPVTKLPARWTWRRAGETYVASYQNVVLDAPMPTETFDVSALTTGLTPTPTMEESRLPAVGSVGMNLQETTLQGRKLDLYEYAAQKRTTVIVFVRPGQANSLSAARQIRDQIGARKDAQMLLVAEGADLGVARQYLRDSRFRMPCLTGTAATAAATAYGVTLYPTVIVLNATGNVTNRMLGYDKSALAVAIASPQG